MVRKKSKESALDLTIRGSIGEFSVSREGVNSVPVKYILSSVGLNFEGSNEQKLMENMKPVREVFDLKELDFEQIMQRDIDDSRVSEDLIPYILDSKNTGFVKLFPPIVVVLVPRKEGEPLDYFPSLNTVDKSEPDQDDICWKTMVSGEPAKESFEFKQMVEDDGPNRHDYAQLKVNTSNTELVIVDGQHRAMALIALFRNLNNSWPDNSSHHETFYKHWTKDIVKSFNLEKIRLPAIFCVFPDLNEDSDLNYTVPKACRSIFLALNKHAKKVTTARNYLMDDNDLVALLLRSTLSKVKNLSHTNHNFRLWAVELDATEDRTKLSSDVSVTGVMPLYNILENVLLYNKSLHGFYGLKSNLHKISDIGKLLKRLNAVEKLTSEEREVTKRKSFEDKTIQKLKLAFEDRIYPIIEKGYSNFLPFSIHLDKFHDFKTKELANKTVHAILFEGQGLSNVFNSHIRYLSKEVSDNASTSSEIEKALDSFKSTRDYIDQKLEESKKQRNIALYGPWVDDAGFHKEADSIFSNTFFTSAFQTAFFMTYFSIIDKYSSDGSISNNDLHEFFDEYIQSVNKTFEKDSRKPFKIFEMFLGGVKKDNNSYSYFPSNYCMKKLLIPGEMKPDEWTSFRYFFLECWKSGNNDINTLIYDDVIQCRKDILKKYVDREIRHYLNENKIEQKDLGSEKYDEIVKECTTKLDEALTSACSQHSNRGAGNLEKLYHQKIKEDSLDEPIDDSDE